MNTMNIVIVEDKQSDFFRLQEQIRSRALTISKIYSCRFHSEFLELLKEKDIALVISENEIGGRSDVGLQFFHEFYKAQKHSQLCSFLYTWGTQDYQSFRIRIHALNQRHPNFLGAVFKQIGDHDKILEIIESIRRSQPHPLFDQPSGEGEKTEIRLAQRENSEKLIDLHHRIEERLLFFINIARFHLEHRMGMDFKQTLKEFQNSKELLLSRLSALSADINELMAIVGASEQQARTPERVLQTTPDIHPMMRNHGADLSSLTDFKSTVETLLNYPETPGSMLSTDRAEVLLQKSLRTYDSFSYFVSRLIDTAQATVRNKTGVANTRSIDA